jgi:arsenate reductase (thioredoxin)
MDKKRILFVCRENANLSQLAQAYARILGGDSVEVYSAGLKPSGVINPRAMAAMAELDYDLSVHDSKSLTELPNIEFDYVATIGCGDECPFIKAKNRVDWALTDPKQLSNDEYRLVRNKIRDHVADMLTSLGITPYT